MRWPGSNGDPDGRRMSRFESLIVGLLILAVLGVALVLTVGEGLIHRSPKSPAPTASRVKLPPEPMEPAALTALEAFFEAPDLATKSAHVRDGDRVRPLMIDYHEKRGHPFPTLGRVSPGHAARFGETPMVLFEVEPFSGPRYPVAVVWDGDRFAVDWESLTAYGTMDWSGFLENKPSAPQTLRLFLMSTAENERPPGAPDGSLFFRIEHRDDPQPVIATADGETATALKNLAGKQRVPVTLEIAWRSSNPGNISVPHILRLVAEKWSP